MEQTTRKEKWLTEIKTTTNLNVLFPDYYDYYLVMRIKSFLINHGDLHVHLGRTDGRMVWERVSALSLWMDVAAKEMIVRRRL